MTFVKSVLKGSLVLGGVLALAAGSIWIFACGQ